MKFSGLNQPNTSKLLLLRSYSNRSRTVFDPRWSGSLNRAANSATLTATLVSGAAHGSVTLSPEGSFTYTPNANFFGTDSFTYKASDGAQTSNTATVTITIIESNDSAPVAGDDNYSVDENETLTVAAPGVLANDTNADDETLQAVLVSGPAHGALALNGNGSFTYEPAANFSGTDSFTYKATYDGIDSNTATVAIAVNPVNDAPVADAGTITTNEDTAANGTLNASDADADPLTFSIITNGAKGTAASTNAATGAFTYTPRAGFVGTDSFTFKVSDGSATSAAATISIIVN